MNWDLYLYESQEKYKKDDCFISPASSGCSEKSYVPRVGEYINLIEDDIIYEAQIIKITHSYISNDIEIDAIITNKLKD